MDPLCATGLLRLIPSLSPGYSCNFKFEGVLFRIDSKHNDRVDSLLEYVTKQAVMTVAQWHRNQIIRGLWLLAKKKLLYCSFRDIDSFAASFASWSAISFPAILAWPGIQDGVVRIPYLINVPIKKQNS
jgi:hypothetical protein